MVKTIKKYQQDVYLKDCRSQILQVISDSTEIISIGGKDEDGSLCLVMDRTVFFPEGGGQPSDTGWISSSSGGYRVFFVFEKEGIVYHQIHTEPDNSPDFTPGGNVECSLDWSERFVNMQRHCGEHILSAVFYDLYGGINRGFHMGSDYMTIDISLELKPEYSQMSDEMMERAETASNEMIWSNLPVSLRFFESREDAEHLPMRKALNVDEEIILVCVGDETNAAGCVACCGTHPHNTGEVGLIKIYKWENYKGMIRITFDAGPKALVNCQKDANLVRSLCRQYSADQNTLEDKIKSREEKTKDIKHELFALKKVYLEERSEDILSDLKLNTNKVVVREYSVLKTDDLLTLSRGLSKSIPKNTLVVLISSNENTMLLLSDGSKDCGKTIKDNAAVWNGKGGGRPDSARAMFPTQQDLECFLDYLKKSW